MVIPLVSLTTLGVVLGALLGISARVLRVEGNPLQDEIDALMPGSQCGQCGFPGCAAAAAAIATGEAPVTLCPPGGRALAQALADKLGVPADLAAVEDNTPVYAFMLQDLCVGCTKCLKRCPTDAIIGAPRQLHGAFPDACIGCEKCFEICPNQAIEMRPIEPTVQTWVWPKPMEAG